jgi:hypothetical protein
MPIPIGQLTTARLDDNEQIFFARQLEQIETTLYEIEYPDLKGRLHFPLNFEGGPAVQSFGYRVFDRTGVAQVGLNFPRVGVKAQEKSTFVKSFTDSYEYNFQEIRNANAVNMSLDDALARAARRAIAELEDEAIYMGLPELNMPGAFTHPNFPIQLAGSALNDTSTSKQILGVFNAAFNQFPILTKGKHRATACLLTVEDYVYLTTTPWNESNSSNLMIMDMIKKGHPEVEFDWCNYCKGAGDSGENIMFVYERNATNMQVRIPHDFETLETVGPNEKYEYVTGCHERFGGLQVRFAYASITYLK